MLYCCSYCHFELLLMGPYTDSSLQGIMFTDATVYSLIGFTQRILQLYVCLRVNYWIVFYTQVFVSPLRIQRMINSSKQIICMNIFLTIIASMHALNNLITKKLNKFNSFLHIVILFWDFDSKRYITLLWFPFGVCTFYKICKH